MNIQDLEPEVALQLANVLEHKSAFDIDHMTVVVESTGSRLANFTYKFPNSTRAAQGADPDSWKYMNWRQFRQGEVVSFLCLVKFYRLSKVLVPVAVIEKTTNLKGASSQSKRWNALLQSKGPAGFVEHLLSSGLAEKEAQAQLMQRRYAAMINTK